ncbi:MAG: hypothetical protein C4567_09140 [Deltaproteobacteria bacterium]|nr:MAG: hypothetical protein C4567_09140 [Deltaproteobacteria bacterium]
MKLTGRFVWIGVLVVLGLLILPLGAQASDWVTKQKMITARAFAGVAVANGQLMVAGGIKTVGGNKTIQTRLQAYSPWSNSWTTLRSMPASRKVWGCGAVGLNDRLYIIGGYKHPTDMTQMSDKLLIYNPFMNSWSVHPDPIPVPCAPVNAAAVVNGKIYVLVNDSATVKKKFIVFDPAAASGVGSWSTTPATLVSNLDFVNYATVQAIDKSATDRKIYVIGGYNFGVSQQVEVYDVVLNTWSQKADMPTGRSSLASGVLGDRIYVMGGWTAGDVSSNKVEIFNPAGNTWSSGEDLTYPRWGLGAAAINGTLYAAGGQSTPTIYSTKLESYTPVTVNVSILAPYGSSTVGVEWDPSGNPGGVGRWAVILRLIYQTSSVSETAVTPGVSFPGSASIPGLVVLVPTEDAAVPVKNWADKFNVTAVNSVGSNYVEVLAVWYVKDDDAAQLGNGIDASVYAAVTEGAAPDTVDDANSDGLYTDDLNALWLASNVAQVDFMINSSGGDPDSMKKKK